MCNFDAGYGEAEHEAIYAELFHDSRKWEAEEESSPAQPGEPGFVVWAEEENGKSVPTIQPWCWAEPWLEFIWEFC